MDEQEAVIAGREKVAAFFEKRSKEGRATWSKEVDAQFAREVRAGAWDHRRDVANAIEEAKTA